MDALDELRGLCDEQELASFDIDLKNVDYKEYVKIACWGISKYLLKDISCKKIQVDKSNMRPKL